MDAEHLSIYHYNFMKICLWNILSVQMDSGEVDYVALLVHNSNRLLNQP